MNTETHKLYFTRQILAIMGLPFMVVAVIPGLLLHFFKNIDSSWVNLHGLLVGLRWSGIFGLIVGFGLFTWCVVLFIVHGKGTLAPWDPPKILIATGPYLWTRNPMILSVVIMVMGQALWRGSWILGAYGIFIIILNHFYFITSEEPGLERRFGESYLQYKRSVPRWLPRIPARKL